MSIPDKQLSNPFSTGGGGAHFEAHVQASFVALMLAGGFAPCMPPWPITKIKLQGKHQGYETDDLILFTENSEYTEPRKLLVQIKHSISFTNNNKILGEVLNSAWKDFTNPEIFTKGKDAIALITGPLSASDIYHVRTILEWARHSDDSDDFFQKVQLSKFSSQDKQRKLAVFQTHFKTILGGREISPDERRCCMKEGLQVGETW